METSATTTPLQITIRPNEAAAAKAQGQFWGDDAPGFEDFLDTINPLQHLPIVSNIYQSLTGDVQSVGSKLAGGALFGGPIGFIGALFDSIITSATGKDTVSNLMAAFDGSPESPPAAPAPTQVASAAPVGFLSPNQRASYNAYVRTQTLTA